jgi:hypothetical protein
MFGHAHLRAGVADAGRYMFGRGQAWYCSLFVGLEIGGPGQTEWLAKLPYGCSG